MTASVRPPAVAGLFYPESEQVLRETVDACLAAHKASGATPDALIVPHAGYVYSGAVAGAGYAALHAEPGRFRRVIVIGPSHRVALRGLAIPSVQYVRTPLGDIRVDEALSAQALAFAQVSINDAAHAQEHSIEVQLPFLQRALSGFQVLPLVVGEASPAEVAEVLEALWQGPDCLVVISTDLSHFHAYDRARAIDAQTSAAIVACDPTLQPEQACGCRGLNGLLTVARKRQCAVTELARCNSGDTAGPKNRVVGYATYAVTTC